MLPDGAELGSNLRWVSIVIDFDIIFGVRVARIESNDSSGLNQVVVNNVLEHLLGVIEELLGLLSDSLVVKDLWVSSVGVLTSDLPGLEEWVPIYEW